MGRAIVGAFLFSIALVLCLRWLPPPTSALMIEHRLQGVMSGARPAAIHYQWVPWQAMSLEMPLAVVAGEDQKFPLHWGFDFESIKETLDRARTGHRLRGASTISQQVAKNLFLWPGRSYLRKGVEAYFTVLLELLWPKQRILEVYVNIVEFGDGVYGVGAAAKTLLDKSPSRLTRGDAALLAAVLPNPRRMSVKNPSPYVMERRQWIREQMGQLGGIGYLKAR
jgi:monofunctional biosynthetic peptidoglycan transglycosylase